jgi:hypothetical protein
MLFIIIALAFTACTFRITPKMTALFKTAVALTLMAQQQPTNTKSCCPPSPLCQLSRPNRESHQYPAALQQSRAISETYPDDSELVKGSDFDKSWRLKNIGTCTWNANYRVVFSSGDQMSGVDAQLLGSSVAPGEMVDIIVDLTTPNSTGTYKGIWKLQDDSGENFATFWVQIKAVSGAVPVLPPAVAALSLSQKSNEGGSVRSDGSVMSTLYNVGDLNTNGGSQVFASFDISGIPAGATITEVKVDFSDFDMLDDPFGDLGCLRAMCKTTIHGRRVTMSVELQRERSVDGARQPNCKRSR